MSAEQLFSIRQVIWEAHDGGLRVLYAPVPGKEGDPKQVWLWLPPGLQQQRFLNYFGQGYLKDSIWVAVYDEGGEVVNLKRKYAVGP